MNKNLITPAIVLTVLIVFGYYYFQFMAHENVPGENMFRLANKNLEDGKYEEALKLFDEVLEFNPDYNDVYLSKAITFMQMGRFDESREAYDITIRRDENYAAAYANRGILNDRTGRFEEAIIDYRRAIELNPEINEGPGMIWKFLRNIHDKQHSIEERANYLEEELKKPESERLLRVPEIDAQQRMYKK
jgi:tetratricopeptide (TPR) repeat protein